MNADLVVWIEASIRKFLSGQQFGLPITYLQQAEEKEPESNGSGKINFLIYGPDFPKIGSRTEVYALVTLECFVQTRFIESDLYYHSRIKGRVVESMTQVIPVAKIGHKDYDKSSYGYLTPVPGGILNVNPVQVTNPYATTLAQSYKLEVC